MGWDDGFRHAAGYFFVLAVLALIKFLADKIKSARAPKPCIHGLIGPCRGCQIASAERQAASLRLARRTHFESEWEKLRRSEVKRLSNLRLSASTAYFSMEPREFEDAVAKIFRKLGYKVAQTPYVGDGGKDAVAWKDGRKYVIECKRYGSSSATGRRDIQILLAAKNDEGADGAIFVTTGRLTAPALAYVRENGIEYYDEGTFADLVNQAYGRSMNYLEAQTICLECGGKVAVRIKSLGPRPESVPQEQKLRVSRTRSQHQLRYRN